MSEGQELNSRAGAADKADPAWKSLFKVGGVAALIATALFVVDIVVLVAGGEAPESAQAWFALLENDRGAGLLQLFFTDIVGVVLVIPVVLALYVVLRRSSPVWSALAIAFAFVGIPLVFATNANYSLITLSDQYAAATTEAERSALLVAGGSVIAAGAGTGPLMATFFLPGGLTMISAIMLRSPIFGRWIAYLGILAHGLDFLHAVAFLVLTPIINAETAYAVGVPLLAIGGTLQLVWYPLIGVKLLQQGRRTAGEM
jgi:hypothetical protein